MKKLSECIEKYEKYVSIYDDAICRMKAHLEKAPEGGRPIFSDEISRLESLRHVVKSALNDFKRVRSFCDE